MNAGDLTLPPAVLETLETLASDGHRAALVGACVRALLRRRLAREFEVASSAAPGRVLALFPHAIPIAPECATVMVPTPAGPVDVSRFRGGAALEDDLAARDFTIDAIGYDPIARGGPTLIDPEGGLQDLEAERLRTVGSARSRLEEDPLRALRAARLVAELALEASPDLEEAMAEVPPALQALGSERVRREISPLLLAPGAGAGLDLLRRTGIEAAVAPGVLADAARLVDRLPPDLPLRLAGWLRGTRAARILARLGFSIPLLREVECLLALHPLDGRSAPVREGELRRLAKRAGDTNLDRLFTLREAELEVDSIGGDEAREARARLSRLRDALARLRRTGEAALRRTRLAIGGREVMEILEVGPGPQVGLALRFLAERVEENPACNRQEELRGLLRAWKEMGP